MSDKYTEVHTLGVSGGSLGLWGHVEPDEAIRQTREHYRREIERGQAVLEALDAGRVEVYHQRGPYAATGRRRVFPPAGQEAAQ